MKRLQQRITQKSYFLMLILLAALSPCAYKHCWHIPYRHAAIMHSTVYLLPLSLTAMIICSDWLLKTSCVLLWQYCWMAAPCEAFNLSEWNIFYKRLFLASVIPLCAQSDSQEQDNSTSKQCDIVCLNHIHIWNYYHFIFKIHGVYCRSSEIELVFNAEEVWSH